MRAGTPDGGGDQGLTDSPSGRFCFMELLSSAAGMQQIRMQPAKLTSLRRGHWRQLPSHRHRRNAATAQHRKHMATDEACCTREKHPHASEAILALTAKGKRQPVLEAHSTHGSFRRVSFGTKGGSALGVLP